MKHESKMTPAAKRTAAVALALFLLLFLKYRPYVHTHTVADSWSEYLFALYFFVCNQSLGIVHEAGHGICYLLGCPEFIMVLNGTLFQLAFPAFAAYYARRRGYRIGMLTGLFFLGFSLKYTAWYMSTAHLMSIVPASQSFLGVDGYHDFHYLFSRLHLLAYNGIIATLTGAVATLLMLYAAGRMLWEAFVLNPAEENDEAARKRLRSRFVRQKERTKRRQ